jgi:hypothetical protein
MVAPFGVTCWTSEVKSAPGLIRDRFADGPQLCDYFHMAHVPDQHRIGEQAETTRITNVVKMFSRNEPRLWFLARLPGEIAQTSVRLILAR